MRLEIRPISQWPGEKDRNPTRSPFKSTYADSLELLDREIWNLRDERTEHEIVVVELDVPERAIRLDGGLRADARAGWHGVIVSFESKHGPLRYACDRFNVPAWGRGDSSQAWRDNLRAIALGLEALRKVDRYGISRDGEQYRGFNALGAGTPMPAGPSMTREQAIAFLLDESGLPHEALGSEGFIDRAYRAAAKRLHPDHGGDAESFQRLQYARAVASG